MSVLQGTANLRKTYVIYLLLTQGVLVSCHAKVFLKVLQLLLVKKYENIYEKVIMRAICSVISL